MLMHFILNGVGKVRCTATIPKAASDLHERATEEKHTTARFEARLPAAEKEKLGNKKKSASTTR